MMSNSKGMSVMVSCLRYLPNGMESIKDIFSSTETAGGNMDGGRDSNISKQPPTVMPGVSHTTKHNPELSAKLELISSKIRDSILGELIMAIVIILKNKPALSAKLDTMFKNHKAMIQKLLQKNTVNDLNEEGYFNLLRSHDKELDALLESIVNCITHNLDVMMESKDSETKQISSLREYIKHQSNKWYKMNVVDKLNTFIALDDFDKLKLEFKDNLDSTETIASMFTPEAIKELDNQSKTYTKLPKNKTYTKIPKNKTNDVNPYVDPFGIEVGGGESKRSNLGKRMTVGGVGGLQFTLYFTFIIKLISNMMKFIVCYIKKIFSSKIKGIDLTACFSPIWNLMGRLITFIAGENADTKLQAFIGFIWYSSE